MQMPERKATTQLGTRTIDLDDLDVVHDNEKDIVIEGAEKLRDEMEARGEVDRYEKMQPPKPKIDESFLGAKIEQL